MGWGWKGGVGRVGTGDSKAVAVSRTFWTRISCAGASKTHGKQVPEWCNRTGLMFLSQTDFLDNHRGNTMFLERARFYFLVSVSSLR